MGTNIPSIPRKIINLKAQNFMRLEAVDITPDPDSSIVTISGKNANGKSSVLNAIWATLENATASRNARISKPVREGTGQAVVEIDLGDIRVTRTWKEGGTSKLEVVSTDTGAKFGSPQKALDELMGKLSFDPLAFTRMSEKDQTTTLLGMVDLGIDLDAVAEERQSLFDTRTGVGRDIKGLGTVPEIDDNIPSEAVSMVGLLEQIQEARAIDQRNGEQIRLLEDMVEEDDALSAQIEDLVHKQSVLKAAIQAQAAQVDDLPDLPDIDGLTQQIGDIEATNELIRANQNAKVLVANHAKLKNRFDILTDEIEQLDQSKKDALANAQFPLDGLSFHDGVVTYMGQPLAQASSAEQLRVSAALATAMDPSIRVMRVTDGSLLDGESMAILAGIADEHGFQIWCEVVDESGQVGFVIEDGNLKG